MPRFYVVLILTILVLWKESFADNPEIEYVYPISTAWTVETNAFGVPKTPYIPYMHDLFVRAGFALKTKPMPPKRLFQEFKAGKSQFGLLVRAPALKDCCLFSQKPITTMPINVYYPKGLAPIKSWKDLVGKKIGMVHGYSYGKLRKFIETHPTPSIIRNARDHEDLFQVLLTRNEDEYVIDYEPISQEMVRDIPKQISRKTVELSYDKLFDIDLYFVVSKALPNAEEIMRKFEEASQKVDVRKFENDFKNRHHIQ